MSGIPAERTSEKSLACNLGQLEAAWILYGLPMGGRAGWLMWLEFISEKKCVMKYHGRDVCNKSVSPYAPFPLLRCPVEEGM